MAISTGFNQLFLPSEVDTRLSEQSSRILAALPPKGQTQTLKVEDNNIEQIVEIPAVAFHLLVDILAQMAQGNGVTLIPVHAELTTQEAADLLNISRPYLIKLLESGQIPFHKIGKHRRIRCQEIINYKQKIDCDRLKVLDKLAEQAQELDLGYD